MTIFIQVIAFSKLQDRSWFSLHCRVPIRVNLYIGASLNHCVTFLNLRFLLFFLKANLFESFETLTGRNYVLHQNI